MFPAAGRVRTTPCDPPRPGRRAAGICAGARIAARGLLLFFLLVPAPPAAAKPQRVVSLNLCTDQLAVLLLPPARIAGLSFLARDPDLSHVAAAAQDLPVVQGSAEEVLNLAPDLVLAGRYTTRHTVQILQSRGLPVLVLDLADSFESIRAQVARVAEAVGEPARGAALLAEMDRRLAAAAPPPGALAPTALTLAPGGFTAGAGTLSDAVMRAAGVRNHAAALGLTGYGYLPVELVAADPPDLLVHGSGPDDYPSLAGQMLAHPALARSVPEAARPRVPGALWSCGGPFTAQAVTLLAAARDARQPAGGPQVAQDGRPTP